MVLQDSLNFGLRKASLGEKSASKEETLGSKKYMFLLVMSLADSENVGSPQKSEGVVRS